MRRQYKEQKQLVLQLIKNCEVFHLDEKRSIECINNVLNNPISRRTYYNYKKELYSDDIYKNLDKRSHFYKLKSELLQIDQRFAIKNEAEIKSLISRQLTKEESNIVNNQPKDFEKLSEDVKQFINKLDIPKKNSKEKFSSIPKNCTIREEFVKCGKELCNLCSPDYGGHGPYYYAYWKDPMSKKLRKKYLGLMDPRLDF